LKVKTRVLEGKPIAAAVREDVKKRVAALHERGRGVVLAIVLVGDDAVSRVYSESIASAAGNVGIETRLVELPAEATREKLAGEIRRLSDDPGVAGIIVQRPLPDGIPDDVLEEIAPSKDVDGATVRVMGLLMAGRRSFAPATPLGVVEMLARSGLDVNGKHVAIVGRSPVVGRPLASLLLRKQPHGNATVTVCHTGTPDLAACTRAADIVVAAMGKPEAIRGDMIREGAVVIDVGVNRVKAPGTKKGYRLVGDVAFDEMLGKASAVTPVPGGVGRLTTAILLRNTVEAAERQI